MHELSIATELIDVVISHLDQYPDARVTSITLSVGVYSGVDPDALRFAFPVVAESTLLENAELIINSLPVTMKCDDCGEETASIDNIVCPKCRSVNIRIVKGTELEITSFEINEPDEASSGSQRNFV
ncbi:Hydrogenase maturation factor HybF [subsurface metagenome]